MEQVTNHTAPTACCAPFVNCECGRITGERCQWSGPKSQTVVIVWMPEQHRASHAAARNSGVYPNNGAERLRLERSCAELLFDDMSKTCHYARKGTVP